MRDNMIKMNGVIDEDELLRDFFTMPGKGEGAGKRPVGIRGLGRCTRSGGLSGGG
jgi:hypothetical protein